MDPKISMSIFESFYTIVKNKHLIAEDELVILVVEENQCKDCYANIIPSYCRFGLVLVKPHVCFKIDLKFIILLEMEDDHCVFSCQRVLTKLAFSKFSPNFTYPSIS